MKACIIQPPYSRDVSFSDEYFEFKLKMLDNCDESIDIIVLPEYSDVPCATSDRKETLYYHNKYIDTLLSKCIETAKRCNALVFVNALYEINGNYRNTTYAYNQKGQLVGTYFKKHLPPLELNELALDSDYTFEFSEPYVIEIDGLRYGFLTCYDFYFYEAFARIARENVDVIIGCSLQRSDSHDAIETMCRFLAYNTNAYVIRSSVSFAEDSEICGAGETPWDIVERAIKYDCRKVQFLKSHFNQEMIDKAHQSGIKCNVFHSDDPEEAKRLLEMGMDTILTNDYNNISQIVK